MICSLLLALHAVPLILPVLSELVEQPVVFIGQRAVLGSNLLDCTLQRPDLFLPDPLLLCQRPSMCRPVVLQLVPQRVDLAHRGDPRALQRGVLGPQLVVLAFQSLRRLDGTAAVVGGTSENGK